MSGAGKWMLGGQPPAPAKWVEPKPKRAKRTQGSTPPPADSDASKAQGTE